MQPGEVATIAVFPRQDRRGSRERVIRRVQLVMAGRAVDAVMLDVSAEGVRVKVSAADEVPGEFLLRSLDGTARRVARRWSQGGQVGLEFIGAEEPDEPLDHASRDRAAVLDMLREDRVRAALHALGMERHFEDETLRVAARDLAAALERVERALVDAGRRMPGS